MSRGIMSENRDEKVTQPMVEALMERLQDLETRLEARLVQTSGATVDRLEQSITSLRTAITSLRTEMNDNFSRIGDEIAILNDDTLKSRATQRGLIRRLGELESRTQ